MWRRSVYARLYDGNEPADTGNLSLCSAQGGAKERRESGREEKLLPSPGLSANKSITSNMFLMMAKAEGN